MSIIRTVTGDINPERLGWCQCHEHIFIADGPSRKLNEALFMDDLEKSLAEVLSYKKAGGQSFVDAQPFGCGRMAQSLKRVSEQTGVNIIACTGFHKTEFFEDKGWLDSQTEETLTKVFIREVEHGMDDSTARAGVIKCAAVPGEYNADKTYVKLFQAAANAAAATGAPVLVHFDAGADALNVIRFFEDNKISANRLILCHLDRARYDFAYHKIIASTGAYLEYDTIHREKYHSDDEEAALIEHMVNAGYEKSLLLGLDTTSQRLKSYGAQLGLDDILTRFRFVLEERMGENVINTIMKDNPARALKFN